MPNSQGLSNNPILSQINPNSHIDTYFSKIHSNSLPIGFFLVVLPVIILKAILLSPILVACLAHLNLLDLIYLTVLSECSKL
jgi:hypothetical protein